ncbi:MAG: rRNA maturation RNase YbeY [Nitrospira sp.]|nr:MAG: rRNA maturation RNase YbeY [Nitrospira sp.]
MPVRLACSLRRVLVRTGAMRRISDRILRYARVSGSELSLSLVGDRRMRRLNARYRRRDRPTDVLAFASREASQPVTLLLGDVVISVDTARRQARRAGIPMDRELVTLLIHGVLHLLGYDHERSAPEARRMQRKERAILRSLEPLPALVTDGK